MPRALIDWVKTTCGGAANGVATRRVKASSSFAGWSSRKLLGFAVSPISKDYDT